MKARSSSFQPGFLLGSNTRALSQSVKGLGVSTQSAQRDGAGDVGIEEEILRDARARLAPVDLIELDDRLVKPIDCCERLISIVLVASQVELACSQVERIIGYIRAIASEDLEDIRRES